MKTIHNPDSPPPKGPFSYAVAAQGLVFVSGHAAVDPASGEFVLGDIRKETALTLTNIARTLEAAHSGLQHVLKIAVFLKDIDDFAAMNEVYREFFPDPGNWPARTTIQAVLGSDIRVEIDAVAVVAPAPNGSHAS